MFIENKNISSFILYVYVSLFKAPRYEVAGTMRRELSANVQTLESELMRRELSANVQTLGVG